MITVTEAANEKGCTGQAVRNAIKAHGLDYQQFGRTLVIKANKKYNEWNPSPKRVAAGKKIAARRKKATGRKAGK